MAQANKVTQAPAQTAPAQTAPAPVAVLAPQAPLFTFMPYGPGAAQGQTIGWPAKAMGGATVRAYCAAVAMALAKAQPQGFTLAQLASAFAASANGTSYTQPATGWGTTAKPNSTALQHARWFGHAKQGWLVPMGQAPAVAAARGKAVASA